MCGGLIRPCPESTGDGIAKPRASRYRYEDIMDIPGFKFHPLKGGRAGEYSVSVTGNWRMTFSFVGEDAVNVSLQDYH